MKRRTHQTGVGRASIIIDALARQSIGIVVIIIIAGAQPDDHETRIKLLPMYIITTYLALCNNKKAVALVCVASE